MGGGSLHHVGEDTRVLDIDDALVDGACQRSGSRLVLKWCGVEGGEAGAGGGRGEAGGFADGVAAAGGGGGAAVVGAVCG